MQKEIRHSWYFNRSPEEVWEYLTKPELLEQWLMETDFQPVVGHKFRFTCSVINYCEVLEVVPFTRLSYSWQVGSVNDGQPFNSKVVWTLVPKGNGTELQLVHDGFTALEDRAGHDKGWMACGDRLVERLKSCTVTIAVIQSPEDVFDHILAVPKWWSRDYEGSSAKLNDEFIIHHPGSHYSKQRLVEVIPGRKVVWLVTDSTLNWLEKDKHEWTHTRMVFEISSNGDKTVLHFTHEGLVPEKECYARCEQGWNMVIRERLFNFIVEGKVI